MRVLLLFQQEPRRAKARRLGWSRASPLRRAKVAHRAQDRASLVTVPPAQQRPKLRAHHPKIDIVQPSPDRGCPDSKLLTCGAIRDVRGPGAKVGASGVGLWG